MKDKERYTDIPGQKVQISKQESEMTHKSSSKKLKYHKTLSGTTESCKYFIFEKLLKKLK